VNRKDIVIIATMLVYIFAVEFTFTYAHESAHKEINRYYSISSHIQLFPPQTIADNNVSIDEDTARTLQLAHSINEAVGYQMEVLLIPLILQNIITLLMLMLLLDRRDKKCP